MKEKKNNGSQQRSTREEETRDDKLELTGVIDEAMPGTLFRVACDNGPMVLCTLAGKLRMNRIRVLPGDKVVIVVSPYDVSRGRITYRLRG